MEKYIKTIPFWSGHSLGTPAAKLYDEELQTGEGYFFISIDKPACLIIRLLFGFASVI